MRIYYLSSVILIAILSCLVLSSLSLSQEDLSDIQIDIDAFKQVIQLEPHHAKVHQGLAMSYLSLNDVCSPLDLIGPKGCRS